MPWTLQRFPLAMRRLSLEVRVKAIEIANAMLAEGYGEGQAILMPWCRQRNEHGARTIVARLNAATRIRGYGARPHVRWPYGNKSVR